MNLSQLLSYSTTLLFKGDQIKYQDVLFSIPRIHCQDGFSISVQINKYSYCSSENGYRQLGKVWQTAEWGFTSEQEDLLASDGEDENTTSAVGESTIELLQQVIDKHGGIDYSKFSL